jgi:hypothetical protein
MTISENLEPLIPDSSKLGSTSKYWSNAYIQDISARNISISGNIIPFINVSGSLGTSTNIWTNAYITNISGSTMTISENLEPLIPDSSKLGSTSKYWSNAYITNISGSNITTTTNNFGFIGTTLRRWGNGYINNLYSYIITPTNSLLSSIGTLDALWPKLFIKDISATNISVSGNIVPLDTSRSELGSVSKRWLNIYANNLSVNTINGQAYGGLTENSVNSSHIIDGSILGTDICDNTIPFTKLDNAFQTVLFGLYTGIFEITNNISGVTFNASFYYIDDASPVYLFENEELTSAGDTKFIAYGSLPYNFAVIPFYLESDKTITSYSLTQANPRNGITNHSKVEAGKIQFNILRNSQHYLELNILTSTNTGWYGNLYIVNQNIGGGGRYFVFSASDATETINIISEELGAGSTYTKTVLIGNRLPNMNSIITFEIDFIFSNFS